MEKNAKKVTLFSITWPILVEVFLYMLLGTVDVLMLGKYSDDAVGAVGVVVLVAELDGFGLLVLNGHACLQRPALVREGPGRKPGPSQLYASAGRRTPPAGAMSGTYSASIAFSYSISAGIFHAC